MLKMTVTVRQNERSWAIELISEINIMLQGMDLKVKSVGGESTLSENKKSMFPDVLLYADTDQTVILQGWELKMPDVPITDQEFIADAERKARALSLNSFVIWNFTYGKLYILNEDDKFAEVKVWDGTNHIKTRNDVKKYKDEWRPVIRDIVLEVNKFFNSGEISPAAIIDILTDNLITAIIVRNKSLMASHFKQEVCKNMIFERRLKVWWAENQEDYHDDETDMYHAYAKMILLHWSNRIVFANIIKEHHNSAKLIETLDYTKSPSDANRIMEEIVSKGDYYNVFHAEMFNDIIPENTWIDIVDFNQFLSGNGISNIDQGVLQDLLERTVSATKKEIRGQFATPERLADLLCQITVRNWKGQCADLCSGTGTIAKAIITNKNSRFSDIEENYSSTWISDKYAYPLQISNIALTSIDRINIPLNMFQSDLFEIAAGKEITLNSPADGSKIIRHFPKLDAVVTNLPFVKYNNIAADEFEYVLDILDGIADNTAIAMTPGKWDLYMILPFKIHELLNVKGRLGIIISNSWLGTDVGLDFFNALNRYYHLDTIVLSGSGRWFENADVVTTLLTLEKKEIAEPKADSTIQFCLTHKPINEITETEKESVIDSIVLREKKGKAPLAIKEYSLNEINRIRDKGVSLNALFHNVDWINSIADKLAPITDYFYVKRGERRGWNDLFYPKGGHAIEEEYIKPVLKNPKHLTDYGARPDMTAFCCHNSIEELKELNHTGALRWIKKFENLKNGEGKPLPEALKRSGSYWYEMDDETKADFITALNPDRRLFISAFDEPTFVDQRFIRLIMKKKPIRRKLIHALLNSVFQMFTIEATGFGRGLGVLDVSASNFAKTHMLDPALIGEADAKEIIERFEKIKNRGVKEAEDELTSTDRKEFDRAVLRALGIEQYYENICESLLSMQRTRHSI